MADDIVYVSRVGFGADYAWSSKVLDQGQKGEVLGVGQNGLSLEEEGFDIKLLSQSELDHAMPYVRQAVTSLRRPIIISPYGLKYMQRDWHVIKDVDAVLAVGCFGGNHGVKVAEGTGYVCQMYANLCKENGKEPNMWLFEMKACAWFRYDPSDESWKELEGAPMCPRLAGFKRVALIAIRNLTAAGQEAIKNMEL